MKSLSLDFTLLVLAIAIAIFAFLLGRWTSPSMRAPVDVKHLETICLSAMTIAQDQAENAEVCRVDLEHCRKVYEGP